MLVAVLVLVSKVSVDHDAVRQPSGEMEWWRDGGQAAATDAVGQPWCEMGRRVRRKAAVTIMPLGSHCVRVGASERRKAVVAMMPWGRFGVRCGCMNGDGSGREAYGARWWERRITSVGLE